eukprot:scaffold15685_cov255-Alexandrium_tamarense.AAC.6
MKVIVHGPEQSRWFYAAVWERRSGFPSSAFRFSTTVTAVPIAMRYRQRVVCKRGVSRARLRAALARRLFDDQLLNRGENLSTRVDKPLNNMYSPFRTSVQGDGPLLPPPPLSETPSSLLSAAERPSNRYPPPLPLHIIRHNSRGVACVQLSVSFQWLTSDFDEMMADDRDLRW